MSTFCQISLETLTDYHDGQLSAPDAAALVRHLESGCPHCTEQLDWLSVTLPDLGDALSGLERTPSPAALDYAYSLARLLQAPPAEGVLQRIARLIGGGGPALAGARGPLAPALQRVYETDAHLMTVWDEPEDGGRRYLIGQVYGRDGAPLAPRRVSVLLQDASEREARTEGGEFHLDGVAPGVYLLRCQLEGDEILVPQLEIGRG